MRKPVGDGRCCRREWVGERMESEMGERQALADDLCAAIPENMMLRC